MSNSGYTAVLGTAVSCDQDGLWLRSADGRELRAAFPRAANHARPGHEIAIAGSDSAAGYIADMLVNRSSGETWHRYDYQQLSWGGAIGRVLAPAHLRLVLLMFIPLVNMVVGTLMGIAAIPMALRVRSFLRTLGLFLLWTAGAIALIGLLTYRHIEIFKGAMMLWYLTCFPLTYVIVMASIEKGADECNGVARDRMQQALESLE